MQAEISPKDSPAAETGGLLVGTKRSERGTVKIVDFIPLATEQGSERFKISSSSMAEVIARCPSDCRIVGYYRTATDRSLYFRAEDLEMAQKWFKDPGNVFLIIADTAVGPSAGFFPWEQESIAPSPYQTFPFSTEKLGVEEWQIQTDFKPKKGIQASLARRLARMRDALRRASIPATVGVIAALLVLAIGIRVLQWSLASNRSKGPVSLGFQVQRAGSRFLIEWDPSVREIRNAKGANLVISQVLTADNQAHPTIVTLTEAQLHSGSTTYNPISFTGKVKFRLDVIDVSGNPTSESTIWVAPAYIDTPIPAPPKISGKPLR